jgi:hypothetical protein
LIAGLLVIIWPGREKKIEKLKKKKRANVSRRVIIWSAPAYCFQGGKKRGK